ncbi:MAG TPA: hypothetical protein VMW58_04705 [Anaerolineae bacterium]|nr:hypothetical protein [Anaerolineae bacterium]
MREVTLRTGVRTLAVAALAIAVSACSVINGTSSVDDIVLTTALDADFCPIDEMNTFSPNGSFYCSLRVTNLQTGSTVTSRWYYGEQFIEEINYQVQSGGHGCVGFELTSPNPWPRGGYRIETYLDGNLERMATFTVT